MLKSEICTPLSFSNCISKQDIWSSRCSSASLTSDIVLITSFMVSSAIGWIE